MADFFHRSEMTTAVILYHGPYFRDFMRQKMTEDIRRQVAAKQNTDSPRDAVLSSMSEAEQLQTDAL
ncbi:Hypothetical protein SMAX5B_010703 [Scophthalmus maximus]|uniref:Uncharacterized protein n=1 Tax=Scophthalmus maximus TaxID=52904 RepID=A0A2U9C7M4_SCOMX|nr:Hypothetical protein SMAX5B_010703 [Scophthalmus maximus]